MEKDIRLLHECRRAWEQLSSFRRCRQRNKDFTYGRQWGDVHLLPTGRQVSEEQSMLANGRLPITNNLIRQLIKSIVGRYRRWYVSDTEEEGSQQAEVDARTLEEFLISGCACQRIERTDGKRGATNVSPARVFFHTFQRPDGADCRFIGMLHDLPMGKILRTFGDGTPERIDALREAFRGNETTEALFVPERDAIDFLQPSLDATHRVIEVWHKASYAEVRCHDHREGTLRTIPYEPATYQSLRREAQLRKRRHEARLDCDVVVTERWQQSWLSPRGHLLARHDHPEQRLPSLMLTLYPMIDGEVHSLVEDIVGQQKYINRLITLLDDVLASSAKGAVIYPSDQLPPGMTWEELRRLWSSPAGIIPFRSGNGSAMPTQVVTSGSAEGASELLKIQMQLFDEISGASNPLRAVANITAGAEALKQMDDSTSLSLLDLLSVFRSFTLRRDQRLASVETKKTE